MTQRNIITTIILLTAMILHSCQSKVTDRPNVILFLADDLGAGDLACTGHPYARTPNIDRLASEGVRFTRAYMPASWCSPTRYGLMQSKNPAREFYNTHNLMPNQPTITKLMKDNGYATAHIGKWHMNEGTTFSQSPGDFGIDFHFTTSSNGPGWTNEQRQRPYHRAKTTNDYVEMAIDFIDKNKDKPFYINLWVHPTHSYIDPSPEQLAEYDGLTVNLDDFKNPLQREFLQFVGQYGDINKSMQAYCADITAMDKAMGKLMGYLKSANLEENTLIAFTSDNGPGPLTYQVKDGSVVKRYEKMPTLLNNVGSAGDFRDRKLSIHDGGFHVPFIVRWPKNVEAGVVNNKTIISGLDWLPTIASVCNIELPKVDFDGVNMKQAFGEEAPERNEPLFWLEDFDAAAILQGNLKGILKDGNFALYDLEKDASESNDISELQKEIADKLQQKLESWLKTVPTVQERKRMNRELHQKK